MLSFASRQLSNSVEWIYGSRCSDYADIRNPSFPAALAYYRGGSGLSGPAQFKQNLDFPPKRLSCRGTFIGIKGLKHRADESGNDFCRERGNVEWHFLLAAASQAEDFCCLDVGSFCNVSGAAASFFSSCFSVFLLASVAVTFTAAFNLQNKLWGEPFKDAAERLKSLTVKPVNNSFWSSCSNLAGCYLQFLFILGFFFVFFCLLRWNLYRSVPEDPPQSQTSWLWQNDSAPA